MAKAEESAPLVSSDTPRATPGTARRGILSKPEMTELAQGAAVFLNFPVKLADKLEFVDPEHRTLTREFWYTDGEEAQISYEDPGEDDKFKYAKLITKNSAQEEMGMVLVLASMTVYTLATQTCFAEQCFEEYLKQGDYLLLGYAGTFVLKVLTWLVTNIVQAQRHIAADTKGVGDLVFMDLSFWERAKTRGFIVLFLFLGVPSELTQAPVRLHIRKPVQPYVTFKAKHHRAWVLGWPCKEDWQIGTDGQTTANLWIRVLFELPLLLLQIALRISNEEPLTYIMVATFIVSGIDILVTAVRLYAAQKNRLRYYGVLRRHTQGGLAAATESGEQAIKELIVNHRLLLQHFGEPIPDDVADRMDKF